MNPFLYTLALKELELCTKLSTLEELIRKYVELTGSSIKDFYKSQKLELMQQVILHYKLLCFGLNLFSKRSKKILPEYIYKQRINAQSRILTEILRTPLNHPTPSCFTQLPTYEEFMDYFEFDTKLSLPNFSRCVEVLNSIIGDKPIHFNISFNYCLEGFELFSTKLPKYFQALTYAIRYKQVNFPTKPQTILDLFISTLVAESRKVYNSELDVAPEILKLKQQISALKSLKSYYDQQ